MPRHPATRNSIQHVTHNSPPHLHRCPKRDEQPLHLAIDAARLACWNSLYRVGGAYDINRGRSREDTELTRHTDVPCLFI